MSLSPEAKAFFCAKLFQAEVRGGKILDIGCDGGLFGRALLSLGDYAVYGIDVVEECAEACLRVGYAEVKICDVEKGIPYPDSSFAGAFAGDVIEHIYDTDYFLREVRRVLEPRGLLVITTPNLSYIINVLLTLLGSQYPHVWYRHPEPRMPVSYYSRVSLAEHLQATGFREVKFHALPIAAYKSLLVKIIILPAPVRRNFAPLLVVSARK